MSKKNKNNKKNNKNNNKNNKNQQLNNDIKINKNDINDNNKDIAEFILKIKNDIKDDSDSNDEMIEYNNNDNVFQNIDDFNPDDYSGEDYDLIDDEYDNEFGRFGKISSGIVFEAGNEDKSMSEIILGEDQFLQLVTATLAKENENICLYVTTGHMMEPTAISVISGAKTVQLNHSFTAADNPIIFSVSGKGNLNLFYEIEGTIDFISDDEDEYDDEDEFDDDEEYDIEDMEEFDDDEDDDELDEDSDDESDEVPELVETNNSKKRKRNENDNKKQNEQKNKKQKNELKNEQKKEQKKEKPIPVIGINGGAGLLIPKPKWGNLEQGVKYKDLVIGQGKMAKPGKNVSLLYKGTLKNGRVFDETKNKRNPFKFKLFAGEVIPGYDIGLNGMREAGKRIIQIPPHAGYGNQKVSGIPKNSTLTFEIELLKVG